MFMLSAKAWNTWRWSSTKEHVSPLYLGRCFKYPLGKASRTRGKNKATYLAYTMDWNAILEGDEWYVCEDDDKEEGDGERGGELVCGGKEGGDKEGGDNEGGDSLSDFKGALITNLWTWE